MAEAIKKYEDLKGKSQDELNKMLLDLRKEQFNMRFEKANGTLDNTSKIRKVRRAIAKVKTAQNSVSEGKK
jgi:large subunit ribosomal protein L29